MNNRHLIKFLWQLFILRFPRLPSTVSLASSCSCFGGPSRRTLRRIQRVRPAIRWTVPHRAARTDELAPQAYPSSTFTILYCPGVCSVPPEEP